MKSTKVCVRVMGVTSLLFATGCVAVAPHDRLTEFAFNSGAGANAFFDCHWRLYREDGRVKAVGVVEATRQGGFSDVWLELQGLDRDGHVVSKGLGRTWSGNLDRWQSQPFYVSLRPTGKEDRYEVRVWAYDWSNR